MTEIPGIDPTVARVGPGCAECLAAHANWTGHPFVRSFEPGEQWYWSYPTKEFVDGPPLAPPEHHPLEQPVAAPAEKIPPDWQRHLH